MNIENWKLIEGFEEYEVSDHGRIRRGSRIKQPRADRKGYLSVALWKNQKTTKFQVSRLVAAAFIGPRPDGCVVAHNNGINNDNRVGNLRYCTPTENEADKAIHGTRLHGEKHHQAKLTEAQVAEIRRRYKFYSRKDGADAMAREFGVSPVTILRVLKNRGWKKPTIQ